MYKIYKQLIVDLICYINLLFIANNKQIYDNKLMNQYIDL